MKNIATCPTCGAHEFARDSEGVVLCRYCRNRILEKDLGGAFLSPEEKQAQVVDLLFKAEKLRSEERHHEELQTLTKAVSMAPDSVPALLKLGRVYRHMGLCSKALECYERARELDPGSGVAYTNTGAVYIVTGEYDRACEWYERGLSIMSRVDPDYPSALANYALALGMNGNKKQAVRYLKKAMKRGDKWGEAVRVVLGISHLELFFASAQDFER